MSLRTPNFNETPERHSCSSRLNYLRFRSWYAANRSATLGPVWDPYLGAVAEAAEGAARSCAGVADGATCWVLGPLGRSCVESCSENGGPCEAECTRTRSISETSLTFDIRISTSKKHIDKAW